MTHPDYNAASDMYALMFLCDFINFLIIVFGYKDFGPVVSLRCVFVNLEPLLLLMLDVQFVVCHIFVPKVFGEKGT